MNHKKIFSLIIFFLFLAIISRPPQTLANQNHPKIISFLNQVRGEECCDPGSIDHLQTQINSFNQNDITATFAIRYDALNDDKYTNLLKNTSHEIAGLLEITPSLAENSSVTYHGSQDNWYQARHVFLVGYSLEERVQLIDTYMLEFFNAFGYYPTTTSAWQIDSFSLNYLQEKYGVTTHQITRNQWGTDSYTMHGGPFHYPYIASENWPFMPGNSNVLIIRQTVADPLRNYADHTSSHTSQPNDYMQNKDFSYFDKLLTQALSQTHNPYSFALLGLENSMDEKFQQEYTKQIEWISQFSQDSPHTQIIPANKIKEVIIPAKIIITHGKNLTSGENQEAIYITTPNYQVRIYKDGSGITITDFRLYSSKIGTYTKDKFSYTPTTYWISPFLIDSSRSHMGRIKNSTVKSLMKNYLEPQLPDFSIFNPSSEFHTKYIGLKLPTSDGKEVKIDKQKISYKDQEGRDVVITPHENYIKINQKIENHFIADFFKDKNTPFKNFPNISYQKNSLRWGEFMELKTQIEGGNTLLIPNINPEEKNISQVNSHAFYPGLRGLVDINNSFLIAHNPIAIVGENPIRIFAYILDENKIPTRQEIFIASDKKSDTTKTHRSQNSTDMTWIDIYGTEYGKRKINGYFDKGLPSPDSKAESFDQINVFFVPNCKSSPIDCLKHPGLMFKFIQLKLQTTILAKLSK